MPRYSYDHPHPAVATDIVVFTLDGARPDAAPEDGAAELSVLLIERRDEPFRGAWALPGGFLRPEETLEACARRELAEETGVTEAEIVPFGTFSEPGRDPRERVISVAFYALVRADRVRVAAGSDAAAAAWHAVDRLQVMAFDHRNIFDTALSRLRLAVLAPPYALALMPETFTLNRLLAATHAVVGPAFADELDQFILRRGILAGRPRITDDRQLSPI